MTSGEQLDACWNLSLSQYVKRQQNEGHCLQYPNDHFEDVQGENIMANSVLHQQISLPSVTPSGLHWTHPINFNDLQIS